MSLLATDWRRSPARTGPAPVDAERFGDGWSRSGADATGSADANRSADGPADDGTAREPGWAFRVVETAECGRTCRDVTAVLTNEGPRPRENVTVRIEIRAGEEVVWTGRERVGRLGAGETHRTTRRVDIGLFGGVAIESNDGYATVVTVIDSDRGTTTKRDRERVA